MSALSLNDNLDPTPATPVARSQYWGLSLLDVPYSHYRTVIEQLLSRKLGGQEFRVVFAGGQPVVWRVRDGDQ